MNHVWQMLPNLWQADIIGVLSQPADCVISCSALSYTTLPVIRPVHVLFPFVDGPELPDMILASKLACMGVDLVRAGKIVVVNCNEGCNRSGLIVGMILELDGIHDPVAYIQQRHPEALYNQTFVNYLKGTA